MNEIRITNRKSKIIKIVLIALLLSLAMLVIAYSAFQHSRIQSLVNQVNLLSSAAKSDDAKTSELLDENKNLKKAIVTLQKEDITAGDDMSANDSQDTTLGSSMTVSNVGRKQITVPENEQRGPLSTEYLAVNVKVTNQSNANQTYDIGTFYAISDNGVIVRSPSFGPGIEQEVWRRSELVPGGSMDVTLLYPLDLKLVTLNLTIPNATDQISVTLPVAS